MFKLPSGKALFTFILLMLLFAGSATFAIAQGNVLSDPPQNYDLVQGWYQGRATFYYEFGANSTATDDGQQIIPAPIYVLVTGFDAEGNPQPVEGQHNIVDVIPGDEGYSDLWQVNFVTVSEDYQVDSITSAEEILGGGYDITQTDIFVNCPIVPQDSTLAEDDAPLVQGWYQGQEVYYFDFGLNSVATAPIYAFITGFDDSGAPVFVEGQNNVVDVIPGDEGYSAFWYVNLVQVPEDYQANSISSAEQVLASGYDIVQPGLLVNCPIVRTDDVPTELPSTGGVTLTSSLWLILVVGGVFLAGFGSILLIVRGRKPQAS